LLLIFLALMAIRAGAAEINFDMTKEAVGQSPSGFRSLATGGGRRAGWKVVEEIVPPILAPLSPNARENFATKPVLAVASPNASPDSCAVLLFTNEMFTDFRFSARFKIVGGNAGPRAGIVFRAQDENNYYVLRASAEGNLLWYRVVQGKQYDMLGIGVKIPIPKDVWMELRIDCAGSRTRCFLNDRLVIPPAKAGAPTDELAINDTTFANGKIGFWTAGDSKSYFVDAHVKYTPKVPFVQTVVDEVMRRYPAIQSLKIYATKNAGFPVVIGDGAHTDFGTPGTKIEADVIEHGNIYYLKIAKTVEVTLALRDRNGEAIAALKVRMKAFPGETQATAVSRATVVKKLIEERVDTLQGIAE
jgi:hypothetical protein